MNTTYIHRDLIQMANLPERKDWATYDVGLWYNESGERVKISLYDLDFDTAWETDEFSYYKVYGTASYNVRPTLRINLGYMARQDRYDDYVNLTLRLNTNNGDWQQWNNQVHIYRSMDDINIDLDNDTDYVRIETINGTISLPLNIDTQVYRLEIPLVWIYDNDTKNNINWHWKPQYTNETYDSKYYLQIQDEKVFFWRQSNTSIKKNREYKISHYWIDDTQTKARYTQETGYLTKVSATGNITIYKPTNAKIGRYLWGGRTASQTVANLMWNRDQFDFPAGYRIQSVEFNQAVLTSSTMPPPQTWVLNYYIGDCGNSLGTEDWGCGDLATIRNYGFGIPVQNEYVNLGSVGVDSLGDINIDNWMLRIIDTNFFFGLASYNVVLWKSKLRVVYSRPMVVHSTPPNNKQQSDHFFDLACNWTMQQPDNISVFLWHGQEEYWNETNSSGENISITTPELHDHHLWKWDCYLCVDHNCTWSDDGNWSFTVNFGADTYFNVSTPENNTIITQKNNTQNLSCDIWGDIHDETQNISFYVNNTLVYTYDDGNNGHHAWYEYTFPTTGIYEWDCMFRLEQPNPPYYNERWSDNGNYTIIANISETTTTNKKIFFLDRSHSYCA